MDVTAYLKVKDELAARNYGHEFDWAESLGPPATAYRFMSEYIHVVVNSGMRATIAAGIYTRVIGAIADLQPVHSVFGHAGKSRAIQHMADYRDEEFALYHLATDKLRHLRSLPWIGEITQYHLARNFGLDYCKPDRHLVRIAVRYGTTPQALGAASGHRVGTVDAILWRAAEQGLI